MLPDCHPDSAKWIRESRQAGFAKGPLNAGQYRCIVVDPPWDQGKTGLRTSRPNQGQDLDYSTMTFQEIAELPIGEWAAPDAFLWLWATNSRSKSSGRPILRQAFDLLEAWDFQYYTLLTWDKRTGPCPFGPFQITTEHCLFAYKEKCIFPKDSMGRCKLYSRLGVAGTARNRLFFTNTSSSIFLGRDWTCLPGGCTPASTVGEMRWRRKKHGASQSA